jgi:uncharacterized protein YecE (DUF72 family)
VGAIVSREEFPVSNEAATSGVIRVGTSGFSFADWKGPFYPASLPDANRLPFYCNYFDTLELNSTYYRPPSASMMENLARKTPDGFLFVVKLHQSMTHGRDAGREDYRAFREALRPLEDSGRLGGVLAQFPWGFRRSPSNLQYVLRMGDNVAPHSLFVEFRHRDWLGEDVLSPMADASIGYVVVDEPALSGLVPPDVHITSKSGYVRLHGRNAATWWGGGSERYLYNYSKQELQAWVEKVRKMAKKAASVYVFFNNCHAGHAARNAMLMKRMLELPLQAQS